MSRCCTRLLLQVAEPAQQEVARSCIEELEALAPDPFLGREAAVEAVRAMLAGCRLPEPSIFRLDTKQTESMTDMSL